MTTYANREQQQPAPQRQQQLEPQRERPSTGLLATSATAGVVCAKCGAVNDAQATFCEQCGAPLHEVRCPVCGATVDPQADFCEACQSYISPDRCSFCGAPMSRNDAFCQQCGSPRSGIVCPTCHTLSHFAFCAHCGTPLTDSARHHQETVWQRSTLTEQVRQLEQQLERLWHTKPVASQRERQRRQRIEQLQQRVMELLSQDPDTAIAPPTTDATELPCPTTDELRSQTEAARKSLQALLDTLSTPPTANPAMARIASLACKPHISRLAWRCNYRDALHPSPLACACPQKGGRWVILSGKDEQQLTADT